ncbi:CD44 antigen [Pygocentrus nattereri]|uniref:CD44 antigen n=1 Tax=Pygocentrus nattereri TaxID=42514 RepID=UPI00081433D6|nr:CD44 antigen [Pygocentrus nattereri]
MWIVLCLGLTFGLLASSWAGSTQEVKVRGCSHRGVYYVQGNDRHSLDFTEAQKLCELLGASLANATQMVTAYGTGLEICRYGWINDGSISIVRQRANVLCRANQTGVIIFKPTNGTYDAFCYDDTDMSDKNCTLAINLESTVDPIPPKPKEVTIVPTTTANEGNHEESTTEDSTAGDQDTLFSNTTSPTEPLDIEKLAPVTSPSEHKEEGETQTTQFSTLLETFTPVGNTEDLTTNSPSQTDPHTQQTMMEERPTASVPALDTTGSGMGELFTKTTGESRNTEYISDSTTASDTGDHFGTSIDTAEDVHEGKMNAPPEDKSNSGSSDWLIIVGVIVAVAAIILICAAVATRKRWCGKHQTLMITSKSSSEGNGTAAAASSSRAQEREQEMVTLMHKEKIQENGNTEEFTVITLEESPEKNQQA